MTYFISNDIEWKQVEEEVLIFSFESKVFMKLNKVGTIIWENIDKTPEMICDKIMSKFDISRTKALNETRSFLDKLEKKGLIVENEPSSVKPETKII